MQKLTIRSEYFHDCCFHPSYTVKSEFHAWLEYQDPLLCLEVKLCYENGNEFIFHRSVFCETVEVSYSFMQCLFPYKVAPI